MLIKVCGLRDPHNIKQVTEIQGVNLIGLIFYAPSARYVDSKETAAMVSSLKKKDVVGVFVDEAPDEVVRKCAQYELDYIQLHGNETPEYLISLQKRVPSTVKFIKAFSIRAEKDLLPTSGYEGLCKYFLFDTPTSGYGGSGRTFDWQVLQYYSGSTPFLLSGGIGPDSVDSLSDFHHRLWAGIDLNSRFEIAPGLKNIDLLKNFVQQINSILP